jgi:hypothetical protein
MNSNQSLNTSTVDVVAATWNGFDLFGKNFPREIRVRT